MGLGVSIFLVALGAVLAFAVNLDLTAIDLNIVGWVLMTVGVFGVILSLIFWFRRKDRPDYRDYYDDPPPPPPVV